MTQEFSLAIIAITLAILCGGILFAVLQFILVARRIETILDHVDREIVPVIRQVEHVTHDLNEVIKNSNLKISRLDTSLKLLEDVSGDVSNFRSDVLSKANKSAILGVIAAILGMLKGRDLVNLFSKKRRNDRN